MSTFDDIRPYNDSEVGPTLDKLRHDKELLDTISRYTLGHWPHWLRRLIGTRVIALGLKKHTKKIDDVRTFQEEISKYMRQAVENTTSEFNVIGGEHLLDSKPHLFVSNHRDIAMDPAFVNWALHLRDQDTLRIAIGDNLLSKPWTSDVMRLNKSFIVQRSITAPRKLFAAFKNLSNYIANSITQDQQSVWIAQREGRAKDGCDTTEPAIIKMFAMAKSKDQTLAEHINSLNIIPVTISYEYDPCDAAKAREVRTVEELGHYQKSEHEDIKTIGAGITGFKGRVDVSFGAPMEFATDATPEDISAQIDRVILNNYVIRPSNLLAFNMLNRDSEIKPAQVGLQQTDIDLQTPIFAARVEACPQADRETLLKAYATPVQRKLKS